jgi:hypothetical protein
MTQRILVGPVVAGTLCLLATTASAQQPAPAPKHTGPGSSRFGAGRTSGAGDAAAGLAADRPAGK